MRKIFSLFILWLIGTAVFILVIRWIKWQDIERVLMTFFSLKGLLILIVSFLIIVVGAWKWKFILKSLDSNAPAISLWEIFFAGFSVTYLFTVTGIMGGEGFRAYTLNKKHPLSWSKNVAVLLIEKVLSISILALFLVVGAGYFVLCNATSLKKTGILGIAFVVAVVFGLCAFYFKSSKKESMFSWFLRLLGLKNHRHGETIMASEEEIFHFFDPKKSLVWKGLGISLLRYLLFFLRCWLIIFFLTGKTNLFVSMVVLSFVFLAYLFPFPAGLGSMEAAQSFVFASFGMGAATGVTFSFILRGIETIIALIGCIFLAKVSFEILMNNIKNIFNRFQSLR